jgi:hypothetical protein
MLDNKRIPALRLTIFAALLALVIALASCNNAEKASAKNEAAQKLFASPADAGAAFLEAARSGDQGALLAIFGPDAKDVLFSGDPAKDKSVLEDFVTFFQFLWARILRASGSLTPQQVRTRYSRGASAKRNWPQSPLATWLTMHSSNTSLRRTMAIR